MRSYRAPIVALFVSAVLGCVVWADGLLYQLPPDGAWTEYELSLTFVGEDKKYSGYLRLSSAGKVKHEGADCRWIEMTVTKTTPPVGQGDETIKLLIPEKHLKSGVKIVEHVVRGWQKRGDKDLKELKAGMEKLEFQIGPVTMFLINPLQDVKKVGTEEIAVEGIGKLMCQKEVGKTTMQFGPMKDQPVDVTSWRHDKAPFGAARMQIDLKAEEGGKPIHAIFEAKLVKSGTGATSILPDSK
jgi:hypothetical protein